MKRALAGAAVLAMVLGSRALRAAPQANAGLTLGVAGTGEHAWWSDTRFHIGAHGDVLFGRTSNQSFGVGPYVEVLTLTRDLQLGGGVSALLPIHPNFPMVLSGGAYARYASDPGWEPGATGQLFWGSRSYNYHSAYVMSGGLLIQTRYGLGDSHERAIVLALHLDGEVLALPFLLLYEAISGPHSK